MDLPPKIEKNGKDSDGPKPTELTETSKESESTENPELPELAENSEQSESTENSELSALAGNPEQSKSTENPELPGLADNPEQSESTENPELPELADNPEQSKSTENPELPELVGNPEQSKSTENPELPGLADNPEQSKSTENPELPGLAANPEQSESTDNPELPELAGNPEQSESTENPELPELAGNPKESESTDNPELPELAGNPEQSESTDNPELPELAGNPEQSESTENPELPELAGNPEQSKSTENPELPGLADNHEQSESTENPELPELAGNPEQSKSTENPELPGLANNPEQSESTESPELSALAGNPEQSKSTENSELLELVENPEKSESTENPKLPELAGNPEQSKSTENPELPGLAENTEQSKSTENSELPALAENSEQSESTENSELLELAENAEQSKSTENSELPALAENSEQSESTENSELLELVENPEQSESTENSELLELVENPEQSESTENSELLELAENPTLSELTENTTLSESTETAEPSGSNGNPEHSESTGNVTLTSEVEITSSAADSNNATVDEVDEENDDWYDAYYEDEFLSEYVDYADKEDTANDDDNTDEDDTSIFMTCINEDKRLRESMESEMEQDSDTQEVVPLASENIAHSSQAQSSSEKGDDSSKFKSQLQSIPEKPEPSMIPAKKSRRRKSKNPKKLAESSSQTSQKPLMSQANGDNAEKKLSQTLENVPGAAKKRKELLDEYRRNDQRCIPASERVTTFPSVPLSAKDKPYYIAIPNWPIKRKPNLENTQAAPVPSNAPQDANITLISTEEKPVPVGSAAGASKKLKQPVSGLPRKEDPKLISASSKTEVIVQEIMEEVYKKIKQNLPIPTSSKEEITAPESEAEVSEKSEQDLPISASSKEEITAPESVTEVLEKPEQDMPISESPKEEITAPESEAEVSEKSEQDLPISASSKEEITAPESVTEVLEKPEQDMPISESPKEEIIAPESVLPSQADGEPQQHIGEVLGKHEPVDLLLTAIGSLTIEETAPAEISEVSKKEQDSSDLAVPCDDIKTLTQKDEETAQEMHSLGASEGCEKAPPVSPRTKFFESNLPTRTEPKAAKVDADLKQLDKIAGKLKKYRKNKTDGQNEAPSTSVEQVPPVPPQREVDFPILPKLLEESQEKNRVLIDALKQVGCKTLPSPRPTNVSDVPLVQIDASAAPEDVDEFKVDKPKRLTDFPPVPTAKKDLPHTLYIVCPWRKAGKRRVTKNTESSSSQPQPTKLPAKQVQPIVKRSKIPVPAPSVTFTAQKPICSPASFKGTLTAPTSPALSESPSKTAQLQSDPETKPIVTSGSTSSPASSEGTLTAPTSPALSESSSKTAQLQSDPETKPIVTSGSTSSPVSSEGTLTAPSSPALLESPLKTAQLQSDPETRPIDDSDSTSSSAEDEWPDFQMSDEEYYKNQEHDLELPEPKSKEQSDEVKISEPISNVVVFDGVLVESEPSTSQVVPFSAPLPFDLSSTHIPHNDYLEELSDKKIKVFRAFKDNIHEEEYIRDLIGVQVYQLTACTEEQPCVKVCPQCKFCCHQFYCTCQPDKFRGVSWCVHMHAANLPTKDEPESVAFVMDTFQMSRPELVHLRAMCYDMDNVTPSPRSEYYLVKEFTPLRTRVLCGKMERKCDECSPQNSCSTCDICPHVYKCLCQAYHKGQLCEHCHVVALYKKKIQEALEKKKSSRQTPGSSGISKQASDSGGTCTQASGGTSSIASASKAKSGGKSSGTPGSSGKSKQASASDGTHTQASGGTSSIASAPKAKSGGNSSDKSSKKKEKAAPAKKSKFKK